MYADPRRVGAFAVDLAALRAGRPDALYRALFATVLFQAMRDVQVQGILRSVSAARADELADPSALFALTASSPCSCLGNLASLRGCTLTKDRSTRAGICSTRPEAACVLKEHTEILGRFGHFGKVPIGLAYAIREAGAEDLGHLYAIATRDRDRREASGWMLRALSRAWRVNRKLASMFLSLVANPDVLEGAPWSSGLDWTQFVVLDTNTDRFLRKIGYLGPWTYSARQRFIANLSERVHLDGHDASLRRFNPRIVQQAMFLFMSRSNRRDALADCSRSAPSGCRSCPAVTRKICDFSA